jgi:hypothetical protein
MPAAAEPYRVGEDEPHMEFSVSDRMYLTRLPILCATHSLISSVASLGLYLKAASRSSALYVAVKAELRRSEAHLDDHGLSGLGLAEDTGGHLGASATSSVCLDCHGAKEGDDMVTRSA